MRVFPILWLLTSTNGYWPSLVPLCWNVCVTWDVLNREKIDFIVSDWNMPQMTGIDLLRKVRASEQFGNIPFLMVTAEAQQENIIEAVQARVSNYIVKPFTADTMQTLTTLFRRFCKAVAKDNSAENSCRSASSTVR